MPSRLSHERAREIEREIAARIDAAGGVGYRSPHGCFVTAGRRASEAEETPLRPAFMRDKQRLLYTSQYARYFQKTQVQTLPEDDIISRRSHHVQSIASIVESLCHALGLNAHLAIAIAYGHDFGHAPFAHLGEKLIDRFIADHDLAGVVRRPYQHELQSKWVIERVARRENGAPLNLTIEVTDGILCHCGEQFTRQGEVTPAPKRTWADLDAIETKGYTPMTLEGATVLIADTLSYLGKDFRDGIRTGAVREDDMPSDARDVLGRDNREIIGTLVHDLQVHSFDAGALRFSDEIHAAAVKLYRFNYRNIYLPRDTTDAATRLRRALTHVLSAFLAYTRARRSDADAQPEGRELLDHPPRCLTRYATHLDEIEDESRTFHDPAYTELPSFRLALDYVQGMTDAYCLRAAAEIEDWATHAGRPPGLFDDL